MMEPRKRAVSPVRIEITPSVSEYRQLCRDLKTLRGKGAASNTAAILDAVRAAAANGKIRSTPRKNGTKAQQRLRPRNRKRDLPDAASR